VINLSGLSNNIFFPGDNNPVLRDAAIEWYKANNIGSMTIGWQIPIDPATGAIVPSATNPLFPDKQFVGTSLSDIQAFALQVSSSGLQVNLKPYFINASTQANIGAPGANENLTAITATMAAYLPQLGTAAQLARATAVILGTENTNLQTAAYTDWWLGVIQAVKANYSGLVGYAATYFPFISPYVDNFPDVHQIPFSSALDFVGVDVYLPVASNGVATYDQAVAAWSQQLKSFWAHSVPNAPSSINVLTDLAAVSAFYGKPLVLTETGYPSSTIAPFNPSNIGGTPDSNQQAILAQAQFDVLKEAGDWLAGAIWFGGIASEFYANYDSASNLGWGLVGKPAAHILADYLAAVGNGAVSTHDDAYIVLQGQSLLIDQSSGVLLNDQSASMASLLSSPTHGTFQLAATGGYNYAAAPGFHGIDSFTYHASATGGSSADGQALLYIVPVSVGTSTTLDLLALTAEEQIAATYVAFFGRGADAVGFAFWVNQFVTGLPVQGPSALFANIASSFGVSDEAKALYPFLVNPFSASDVQIGAFLDSVYNNLFNRSSDALGLAYWTAQTKATLAGGQFVGSILVNIMSGAQDTAAGKDITTLMGKVAVSLAYVHEQVEQNTVWSNATDLPAATNLLQAVASDMRSVLIGVKNAETLIANHA